ncbi:MAG: molecular chaperone [Thermoanaerobaculia bacterium]
MELFRSLAVVAESAAGEAEPVVAALKLGSAPSAAEFAELFEFQLYPYASVYLGGEGMLGGEARDRIAGFWRALGESPPPEPDHLAVLLAAYAELVGNETGAQGSEDRSRWRLARSAFLWEHLLSWLPVYLDRLGELGSEFYRAWGTLLTAALLEEAARLPAPDALPLHLRGAPPLGDLENAGGDEFLKAVTTPVRTGMVLTGADLERCARSLSLGLRKGERRYVLKSLLGQAPKATLEWLAGEADRQAALHRDRPTALATVSAFWRERADKTAVLLRGAAPVIDG